MDYLARESAPFSSEFWAQIDDAAIGALKKHLVCRRFLNLFGRRVPDDVRAVAAR